MWIKITPEYLAGIVVGIGGGIIIAALLIEFGVFSSAGRWIGLLGMVLIMLGGIWKLKVQKTTNN